MGSIRNLNTSVFEELKYTLMVCSSHVTRNNQLIWRNNYGTSNEAYVIRGHFICVHILIHYNLRNNMPVIEMCKMVITPEIFHTQI
jgi:hypothetical protein